MNYSVCVVIHNSIAELQLLLNSIDEHLHERPQVIIADSGSSDDGAVLASSWGAEVLRLPGNPGFGAANNAALALVQQSVTVMLNPDCVLLDNGLEKLAVAASESRVIVAPKLFNSDHSLQRSAHPLPGGIDAYLPALTVARLMPQRLRNRFEPYRSDRALEVGWAIGACLAASTELLRELGPFNANDFLFAEDLDLCLRARGQGVPTIFNPSIGIEHSGAHTSIGPLDSERFALQASRRRDVIRSELGARALVHDDRAQALTFASRALVGRDRRRNKLLLRSLRDAQKRSS